MPEPLYPGQAISLDEIPSILHAAERALYETLAGLKPLLEALRRPQPTPELESGAALVLQVGEQLDSGVHAIRSARCTFDREAELDRKARAQGGAVAASDETPGSNDAGGA